MKNANTSPKQPNAADSELLALLENLDGWGQHFREKQHGVTLSILRAKKTLSDQAARIGKLEDTLNLLFHYSDCTSRQMEIIEEVLPQIIDTP